ncbi:MAG: flavodoxin family protein [Firmicutes bacterium]|nr:flavodoxin family protein [Bacillota bacterium]
MKALLLNGSPRQGNTYTALEALKKGFANIEGLEVGEIEATNVDVSPCVACDTCGETGKCVFDDDTNEVIAAVLEADVVVFATPVYWWGITAQLKLIIDKMYSRGSALQAAKKKVGIIAIGEADQEDVQYELIARQFEAICGYLGWEIAFCNTYTAGAVGDLAADEKAVAEIEDLWKNI